MLIFDLLLGFLLLFFGRKLFWLSVGIVGFLVGVHLAVHLLPEANAVIVFAAATMLGITGALLAVVFEWLAVVFAVGYLGGGYFLFNFSWPAVREQYGWLLYIIGGVIGMLVTVLAFDWALMAITSILGAMVIIDHLNLSEPLKSGVFAASTLLGVTVQYLTTRESSEETSGQDHLQTA
jgi:hypothetical protein